MFQAMGAPGHLRKTIESQKTEVFPENIVAVRAFLFLQTQWRSAGMGGRIGLVYQEAWKWMDEQGITRRKKRMDLMECLQVMEAEALKVWCEKRQAPT
jgi:hypothetical protein